MEPLNEWIECLSCQTVWLTHICYPSAPAQFPMCSKCLLPPPTIHSLVSTKFICECVALQLTEVVKMFACAGDYSLGAVAYQVRQQQQWLQETTASCHSYGSTAWHQVTRSRNNNMTSCQSSNNNVVSCQSMDQQHDIMSQSMNNNVTSCQSWFLLTYCHDPTTVACKAWSRTCHQEY